MKWNDCLIIVFALSFVATLIWGIKKKKCKATPSEKECDDKEKNIEMAKRVFCESLVELEKQAKGFALYEALLKTPLDAETQRQLYKEYGECYVEPSFASVSAAERYKDVFWGPEFWALVKDYLNKNGVEPGSSMFIMSNQMGLLVLKMHRNEMEKLVQRKKNEGLV